jgi:hypothetical protein
MDRVDCFQEYWRDHPEEHKRWMKAKPNKVASDYGIQSEKFYEFLELFSPDNPEILYCKYEYYIINKNFSEGFKMMDTLKTLYPKYSSDWENEIEFFNYHVEDIEKTINTKKVTSILEFIEGGGR